jgi:hypothetical protein
MDKEVKKSINYIRSKTDKNTGFCTPQNYFNNLEDVINVKLYEEKFPVKNGFKAPDTYFNNIEDRFLSTILVSKKETKVIYFKDKILKMIPYAAAASIVLFISLNSFVFTTDEELTINSLTDTEIEYWLDSNTLNTNDISIVLEDELLKENDFYFTTIKDETIEDYINSIDSTTLLNEIN